MAAAKPAGPAGTQWIAVEFATFHRFSKAPKSHSSGLVPAKLNAIAVDLAYHFFSPKSKQTKTDQGPLTQSCNQTAVFQDCRIMFWLWAWQTTTPRATRPSWNQTGSAEKRNFGLPRPGDQTLAEKSSNIGLWENLTAFWDLLQILFKKVCVSLYSILWPFWSILQLFHSWLFALPVGTIIPNPVKPLHRLSWDAEVSETASFCLAGQGQVPGFAEFQDVPSTSFNIFNKSQILAGIYMHLKRLRSIFGKHLYKYSSSTVVLNMLGDHFRPIYATNAMSASGFVLIVWVFNRDNRMTIVCMCVWSFTCARCRAGSKQLAFGSLAPQTAKNKRLTPCGSAWDEPTSLSGRNCLRILTWVVVEIPKLLISKWVEKAQ